MQHPSKQTTALIVRQARSFGATLAGVTTAAALRQAPSYRVRPDMPRPPETGSILVLALIHDPAQPELDWWGVKGGTPGNLRLINIANRLVEWLGRELDIAARSLPYYVEKGGVFLKDAAVLAGLGHIGANNLVVTPQYGPCVRFRALFLDAGLAPTATRWSNPCADCHRPCLRACPQGSFQEGSYHRSSCMQQIDKNKADAQKNTPPLVKHCRACELSCPLGLPG